MKLRPEEPSFVFKQYSLWHVLEGFWSKPFRDTKYHFILRDLPGLHLGTSLKQASTTSNLTLPVDKTWSSYAFVYNISLSKKNLAKYRKKCRNIFM